MYSDVAFFCTSDSRGGLEMNLVQLALSLRKLNYNIKIITVQDSYISELAESNNLKVIFVKKHKKYFDYKNAFNLASVIRKNDISHLFVFHNYDQDVASNSKIFNKSVKLYFHQNMHIGGLKKDFFHNLRYSRIDAWISPLKKLADDVINYTNIDENKIHIIPYGVNTQGFNEIISKRDARKNLDFNDKHFIIGILGRIDRQKDQLTAIKAMELISHDKIKLVIAGEPTKNEEGYQYYEQIKNYITQNNLTEKVKLINFVENPYHFYKAIDVFCITSLSETYGLVTIEAMMSGTPVIGANSGGTTDLLQNGKYGTLFEPNNPIDLAEKINLIFSDYPQYQKAADSSREYAHNEYSKDKECERLIQLIRN